MCGVYIFIALFGNWYGTLDCMRSVIVACMRSVIVTELIFHMSGS